MLCVSILYAAGQPARKIAQTQEKNTQPLDAKPAKFFYNRILHKSSTMSATPPSFPVLLRLENQPFDLSVWQPAAQGIYRDYLDFYSLDTSAPVCHGWLHQQQQRCWVQAFRPAGAPAGSWVHLHGYYDHGASYPRFQRWVLAQGFQYIALDLPGHGLSSGARASIGSFDEYHQWLRQLVAELQRHQAPRPWILSGFSTGGAIALDNLLHQPDFDHYLLLAPLIQPLGWSVARRWLWLLRRVKRSLPRKFRENTHDQAFIRFVHEQDPLQSHHLPLRWVQALAEWIARIETATPSSHPALVLQGEADTTVDWRYNLQRLAELLPQSSIQRLPDARHQLLNEAEPYWHELTTYLTRWLDHQRQAG